MSQPLYTLFKRTGAYTLFKDESEMERTNVGNTALHVVVGQSRFPNAPVNTLIRIQDPTELMNTLGTRDRNMERRGNFLYPYANTLLTQGPIFVLNLRTFDDTKHKVDNVSLQPAKDSRFVFNSNKQVPITSIYDRTGFWKVDKELIENNIKEGELLMFSTYNSKSSSIVVTKADMSNTEFANRTVADYNTQHPRNPIECVSGDMLLSDLFYKVDVFSSRLVNDLKTNFNPALSGFLATVADPDHTYTSVLGATLAEQNAKLAGLMALKSSNYLNSYIGCIIPDVVSTLNDKVSIDAQFNADSKIHGMVCTINDELIEDWAFGIENGETTAIKAYFDKFEASTVNPVPPQVIDLKGSDTTDDQFVDGTVAKQNEILDLVVSRGIQAGLLAYKKNDFSYLMDSFKSYIQPNDKWQLAKTAYETKRISYLYSTPFIKDFAKEPTYQDDNGIFDAKFIAQGGNPTVSDPVLYSMAGDGNGDVATFPFAGGLIYDDGGGKQITIPASVAGAIAYGAKHLSATKKPYSIVNGPVNGLVNMPYIVDVAHEFSDYDLNWLEPFGWNCILKSGTVFEIRNDATAKNVVKSSLSYASNYELITYISREGRLILEPLIGERNNDITRLRAKQGLDAICNRLSAEGVIESYTNVCDLTNNTVLLRKQGFLVADTVIVTADGIRIVVHQIDVKLTNDVANIVLE